MIQFRLGCVDNDGIYHSIVHRDSAWCGIALAVCRCLLFTLTPLLRILCIHRIHHKLLHISIFYYLKTLPRFTQNYIYLHGILSIICLLLLLCCSLARVFVWAYVQLEREFRSMVMQAYILALNGIIQSVANIMGLLMA